MTVNEQDLVLMVRRLVRLIRNASKIESIEDIHGALMDAQLLLDRRELQMTQIAVAPFAEWRKVSTDGTREQFVSPCNRYRIEKTHTGFSTLFDYQHDMKIVQCGDVEDAMSFAQKHARGEKWTA